MNQPVRSSPLARAAQLAAVGTRELDRRVRRGSVYVLVLGAATLVAVVGIGAIALARSSARSDAMTREWAEAGVLAQSGIEIALGAMNTSSSWRTDFPNRTWIGPVTLGSGSVAFTLVDESDGDVANNVYDQVRVYASATVGQATRVYSVLVAPSGPMGFDALRAAAHSASGMTTSAPVTAASGPLSTNGQFRNSGSTTADVEAQSINNTGTINGFVTVPAAAKAMPDDSVISTHASGARSISYFSLSGGKIEKCVLSAANNPYGSTNARGVYVIDVPAGADLCIRECRIQATLIVRLGLLSKLEVKDAVLWDPPGVGRPSLLVNGALTSSVIFGGTTGMLKESGAGNLNPSGTPYLGSSDSDVVDEYPSELRGLFHVVGSACPVTVTDSVSIVGCLLSDGAMTLDKGARLTANTMLQPSPPLGYSAGGVMKPVQGTFRWEVAAVHAATAAVAPDGK